MQAMSDIFVFRVTPIEKSYLMQLSALLERNQSDTMRYIVREAAKMRGLVPSDGEGVSQPEGHPDSAG